MHTTVIQVAFPKSNKEVVHLEVLLLIHRVYLLLKTDTHESVLIITRLDSGMLPTVK